MELSSDVSSPDVHPMAALLDEIDSSLQEPQTGEIRNGIIVDKRPNEVLIDIGFKSEGVVSGREIERFDFPRQREPDGLCLSDFVRPAESGFDYVAMFVTTVGEGIRGRAEELKNRGEYVLSHALQALAIESAEAYAEKLHRDLRTSWGFPDPPGLSMTDRFKAKYQGVRVSFGYPACPEMSDQAKLFALLEPQRIGCQLTENWQIDPEQSTSAIIVHHPEAKYFNV